ncbi:hypothetical protein AB0469_26205 [Streptomyces sp. NPDC093801]|uniref:hypothetical protein n=1 Tax=Streptomyces sp. NPDC093801 TaxID=3155203 RepID=UPI00344DE16F
MGVRREVYDEYEAAGRLKVSVAAWRWATGSRLVPPADAGPGRWSRAVMEACDPEAVRAALRGPIGAGAAADRLTEALGVPLPILRPRVTASAIGHLVKAGLLVYLGGEAEFPDVHPDQVAALARRRDLPALLDRHVPLGPDQAARRLGVRRTDFDLITGRLGWLSPVGSVDIDYKRQGGVTTVPLYSAEDVALLEVVHPAVDWRAVRMVAAGRRSPLAALEPVPPGGDRLLLAGVARIAGVGRAAVVNWRRRHPDFPAPVAGTDVHPQFDGRQIVAWLLTHDKIEVPVGPTVGSLVVAGADGAARSFRLDDPWLSLAEDAADTDCLSAWAGDEDADALAELAAGASGATVSRLTAPGTGPLAVLGEARLTERFRSGSGGLRIRVEWPARLRGAASERLVGGVVRHGTAYAAPGGNCGCRRFDCGGVDPVAWCREHGDTAQPVIAQLPRVRMEPSRQGLEVRGCGQAQHFSFV